MGKGLDSLDIYFIVVSILSIVGVIVASVIINLHSSKRIKAKMADIQNDFNRFKENNDRGELQNAIKTYKTTNYFRTKKSKIITIVPILIIEVVIMFVGHFVKHVIEFQKVEINDVYEARKESFTKEEDKEIFNIVKGVVSELEIIGIKSFVFFQILLSLGTSVYKIIDVIEESHYESLNREIKNIIVDLEYRLQELSEDKPKVLKIRLPDDENYLEVEKILSADQKLQINSYVWHRTMKAPN